MTNDAAAPSARGVPLAVWIFLAYMLLTAPVAGLVFVLILAALNPIVPGDLLSALPAMVGFAFIIGFVPALLTGIVAALLQRQNRGVRLIIPALVAAALAVGFIGFVVLRPAGDTPPWTLLGELAVSGAVGALASGGIAELLRRTRA